MMVVLGRLVGQRAAREVAQPEKLSTQLRHADEHPAAVDVARSPKAWSAATELALLVEHVEDRSRPIAQVGLLAEGLIAAATSGVPW